MQTCDTRRKRTVFAAAAARAALAGLLLAGSAPAGATLLVYEPFDYPPGVLGGQTATGQNLSGAYAGSPVPPGFDLLVASPGLDYGSLVGGPQAAGNRLSQALGTTAASATVSVDAEVSIAPGSAIFFSALFTLDDSQNGTHRASITLTNDANGDELTFGEPVVGIRGVRVSATTAATGGTTVAAGADGSFSDGDTLFLVGRYLNSASAQGDVLELVGYDTADVDVLPASYDPSDPNAKFSFALADVDIDLTAITSISFTIRGTANNFIDELRIGTSYGAVVPEPATAPLLLAGLVGLRLASARRRRRGGTREGRRGTGPCRSDPHAPHGPESDAW